MRVTHYPLRWLLAASFLLLYCIITFYIAGFQHGCPTAEQMREHEEKSTLESVKYIASLYNRSSQSERMNIRRQLLEPLVKVGMKILDEDAESHQAPTTSKPPTPKPTMYANELAHPNDLLQPLYATNMVFYVWCGRRWFEFQHYLSLMSVIRLLRPDNLIFFYDTYPVIDSWTYNTWFDELRNDYPFLRLVLLEESQKGCDAFAKPNTDFILRTLSGEGGMYVNEHVILSEFPVWYKNLTMVYATEQDDKLALLMTQPGFPGKRMLQDVLVDTKYATKSFQCVPVEQYVKGLRKPPCVVTNDPFFPKDIWDLDNSFGSLARRTFYGIPEIRRPEQNYDELIPNIAHIVWIGGGEMDFLFYLCVLSLIYVAEVDRVYIHGDAPPTGHYWESIKSLDKLTVIYRETPKTIYQTPVNVLSHVTDVWRVDFMIKYGGIYVDTDTVFVRPLDRDIRAYDAVGTYDWTYWNHPFPDTINFGVAIGKRNAKYWHLFQESMRWFKDDDWAWNGLRQPYRIKERHPDLVLINPRLQVTCFEYKCHPTWWPNYHDENVHHLNSNSLPNWRTDVYAFHWTLPTPPELLNEENLYKSDTIFAEIGRHILEKAGRGRKTS